MLAQLIRFGIVGGLTTLAHVSVALSVQMAIGVSVQQANLAGFATAVLFSYLGHARFTFGVIARSQPQFLRFAVLSVLSLIVSSGTVWLVTGPMGQPFAVAMAAVAALVPTASYLAMRFWVFSSASDLLWLPWRDIALPATLTLALAALFWNRPLSHDVAWYLFATRDWLGGAALYDFIMEVNPPLNFYLTAPAILTADFFDLTDTHGQYVIIWVMLFASLVWCNAIIRTEFDMSPMRQAILLIAVAAAIIAPSLDNVGQREYHLVVLMMPWLLGQLSDRPRTPKNEIATTAIAAIGVCLKPHFVLFPLAVTAVRSINSRSLRPILSTANLTFLTIGILYIGYVATVHPTYFLDIVPMAGLVYGAYSTDVPTLLAVALRESLCLLLPAFIALFDREGRVNPTLFAALCLAGYLSFLLQAKGFGYHLIPFVTFGLMACFLMLLNSKRIGPLVISVATGAAGLMGISISDGFYRNNSVDQIILGREVLGDFKSIMVLSPHVYAGPPIALATGAEWASRYPANWLVPGALNRLSHTDCSAEPEMCERLAALAARNRSENIADMIANRPELLVVDLESSYFEEPRFDWLAFMAEDPAWAAVFDDYHQVGSSSRYLYFRRAS